ncbi:M50 family metallopeptidase [Saccharomonospora iraqiensis]|uniref:M50 family metallopeptidase n=1 Tax=Saccharomonospora iraqiensis TaxID=52698 RepID=UPI00040BC129|nr:site-2 protease family protein [Saccharomonospora iraqiensis]
MLVYLLGVALFALGICVSVALHEAGHMATAKMFGMKVRRYFVGFGPTVFSFRRGETEYGLKWIPLGGFCDIAGMTALDEVKPDEAPRAMWRYKVWKRTVVLAAGSFTHFVLGFVVLYLMAVSLGLPNLNDRPVVGEVSECVRNAETVEQFNDPQCGPGDPAPARAAGLESGDEVVSINGTPVNSWSEMVSRVQNASGPTPMTVVREGERERLTVDVAEVTRPTADGGTEQVGMIGASQGWLLSHGAVGAVGASVAFTGDIMVQTWERLLELPEKVPAVVEAIFGAERDPETPVSVVGASRIGGEAVEAGLWGVFLLLLASLNFFVGIFNLLPLLPLDGGHIAVTWYERVRDWLRRLRGREPGGPVDYTKLNTVTGVVIVIGGAFVLLTVTADIVNPIRLTQ